MESPIRVETEIQPARGAVDLSQVLDAFIAGQDVAESSRQTYRRCLRPFTAWLEDTGRASRMDTLTRADILAYKEHLQKAVSSYTLSGYITAVRRLYEWLEAEKLYPNIAKGIKGAKKPRGHRKDSLTPAQIRRAMEQMDRSTPEGLRDFALFNLMVRTGLRTVEVARALVEDLRQEGGEAVLWIQGKGRDEKDDFVLLVDETLQPIREWLASRGSLSDEEPLFCSLSPRNYGEALSTRSLSRIIKEALQDVGLNSSRLTAHSLRHSAVSLSIAGGASLQQAQAMARHSDPRTTLVYFHNADRIRAGAERCIQI